MTPLARAISVDTSASPVVAYRLLTQHHFDQAPALDDEGAVVGLVTRTSLRAARKVRVTPLGSELLIDEGSPVGSALARLVSKPMLFVVSQTGLVGFVTPSDLNKHPVRVHFYLLIADLEMTMAAAARGYFQDPADALPLVSDARRRNVLRRYEGSKTLNVDADVLTALEFPDLVTVMMKSGLRERFGYTSGSSWNEATQPIKAFRDFVMHPTSELLGTWSISQLTQLESVLRRMLGESEPDRGALVPDRAATPQGYSQRITANDIRVGQVRIPRDAKALFPAHRTRIEVDFLGHPLECRWDPRYGPRQERSGVIGVGRALMRLAREDEILFLDRQAATVRLSQ